MSNPFGLIPACAGKTFGVGYVVFLYGGSSPRVRGKLLHTTNRHPQKRLIPACAGKTMAPGGGYKSFEAHPRVCGENCFSGLPTLYGTGSSPRVRGKLRPIVAPSNARGLIPACAGKTLVPQQWTAFGKAHPRVCGENRRGLRVVAEHAGSSPRVRGKPRGCGAGPPGVGLIPACAGKTAFEGRG